MNKQEAKRIASSRRITWGSIKAMLERALEAGADDDTQSRVNPSFTKFEMLNQVYLPAAMSFDDKDAVLGDAVLPAQNMLREFGEYFEGDV